MTSPSSATLLPAQEVKTVRILGLEFFGGTVEESVERVMDGGLVMLPAAPTLADDFRRNPEYRRSLQMADVVLPDSGAMVLAWNFLHWGRPALNIYRVSGLTFLRVLLARRAVQEPGYTFWVMPSVSEKEANLKWLRENGFGALCEEDTYLAPHYRAVSPGPIRDEALVRILEERRPKMVLLNVGGGTQEPLGAYLKENLSYQPAIICSGAAIAFLAGGQVNIPPWADELCLGWLFRIFQSPKRFGLRYYRALPLFGLLARHRGNAPKTL